MPRRPSHADERLLSRLSSVIRNPQPTSLPRRSLPTDSRLHDPTLCLFPEPIYRPVDSVNTVTGVIAVITVMVVVRSWPLPRLDPNIDCAASGSTMAHLNSVRAPR